jgi:AcrR family transcriptional regulator
MDQVAEAAGISRSNLFRVFPSKAVVVWGGMHLFRAELEKNLLVHRQRFAAGARTARDGKAGFRGCRLPISWREASGEGCFRRDAIGINGDTNLVGSN